jgi:hypothetical protein
MLMNHDKHDWFEGTLELNDQIVQTHVIHTTSASSSHSNIEWFVSVCEVTSQKGDVICFGNASGRARKIHHDIDCETRIE